MKKFLVGVLALALMAMVGVSYADLSGEAEAHVWVDVVPNIAVGIPNPEVDIGEIQMGEFEALITFRIDANVESVKISIIATDLYKGDVPTSQWTIGVKTEGEDTGALVEPAEANAMEGHGNLLAWVSDVVYENGMAAHQSEQVAFESGTNGNFSQDVDVTITYDQDYAELPVGEYSGFVKLIAVIDPY